MASSLQVSKIIIKHSLANNKLLFKHRAIEHVLKASCSSEIKIRAQAFILQ